MQYKRFAVYQCSSCERQIEIQQDPKSPGPSRCNITFKCPGLLSLVNTRSVRTELFPPVVFGLQDYIQRGTVIAAANATATVASANLTNSGDTSSLVLAGLRKSTTSGTNHFYVIGSQGNTVYTENLTLNPLQLPVNTKIYLNLYQLTAEILQYNQYIYNRSSNVQFVQGADDSAQSKNLRFSSGDKIRVFLNGIEMVEGTFDTSIANQINFTPMLTGTSNVIEIYVYQDITTAISNGATLTQLMFKPLNVGTPADLAERDVNAWGDVGSVNLGGSEQFLLFCTDIGTLDSSASYGISSAHAVSETGITYDLDLSSLNLLISYPPYGYADKDLTHYVNLNDLATGDGVISMSIGVKTGQQEINCAADYVTNTYKQLTIGVSVASSVTSKETNGTTLPITQMSNAFILGPS
jgi:hypothetical protein